MPLTVALHCSMVRKPWRDQLEFEELLDAGLRRPRGGELNMGN